MGIHMLSTFVSTYRIYRYCSKLQVQAGMSFLIDGHAFAYHLYRHHNVLAASGEQTLDWMLGGEYDQMEQAVIEYVNTFRSNGVKHLCFCFDGCTDPLKLKTSLNRAQTKAQNCNVLFMGNQYHNTSLFLMPPHVISLVKYTLLTKFEQTTFVTVIQTEFEADPVIAHMAQSGEYTAILSNDTDFMVYKLPESVGYAPFDCIQMVTSEESSLAAATTNNQKDIYLLLIKNSNVAEMLGIDRHFLPLIPCLAGSDYINISDLQSFHDYLRRNYSKKKKKKSSSSEIFPLISQFLKTKGSSGININDIHHDASSSNERYHSILTSAYSHCFPQRCRDLLLTKAKQVIERYSGLGVKLGTIDQLDTRDLPYSKSLIHPELRNVLTFGYVICQVPLETSYSYLASPHDYWWSIRKQLYAFMFFKDNILADMIRTNGDESSDSVTIVEYIATSDKLIEKTRLITRNMANVFSSDESAWQKFCAIWKLDPKCLSLLEIRDKDQSNNTTTTTTTTTTILLLLALFTKIAREENNEWEKQDWQLLLKSLLTTIHSKPMETIHPNCQVFDERISKLVSVFSIGLTHIEWTIQVLGLDLMPFYQVLKSFSGLKLLMLIRNANHYHLDEMNQNKFESICELITN